MSHPLGKISTMIKVKGLINLRIKCGPQKQPFMSLFTKITIKAALFFSYLKVLCPGDESSHVLWHKIVSYSHLIFMCSTINLYHFATLVIYFKRNLWCVIVT